MNPTEKLARELLDSLKVGPGGGDPELDAKAEGGGLYWHVDASKGDRKARVHVWDSGDHLLRLNDAAGESLTGRTRARSEVQAALFRWLLDRKAKPALWAEFSFLDRSRRQIEPLHEALRASLGEALTLQLTEHSGEFFELWAHAAHRSVRFEPVTAGTRCTFQELQTTLATGTTGDLDALTAATREFLRERASFLSVAQRQPWLRPYPHAEAYAAGRYAPFLFSRQLAAAQAGGDRERAWHLPWLKLLTGTLAEQFFTFTSHLSLCFSRCPESPYSTWGLPTVTPWPGKNGAPDRFQVACGEEPEVLLAAEAAARVSRWLEQSEAPPFYGSAEYRVVDEVNFALRAQGTSLRAELVPRGGSVTVELHHKARSCTFSGTGKRRPRDDGYWVALTEGPQRYASLDALPLSTTTPLIDLWMNGAAVDPLLADFARLGITARS